MILYFDTSALIKKYISEEDSNKVDELFNNAEIIYISEITEIETFSTFKRLLIENAINDEDYKILKKEFEVDFNYFEIIEYDREVIEEAKKMIEKYQVKTLDSIQLASVKLVKDEIDYFIVCDSNLIKYGKNEGLNVINPNE